MSQSTHTFGLTSTERYCLLCLQELTALDSIAPSLGELANEMSLSSKGRVQSLLRALRDRGYIDWLPCRPRSIIVLRPLAMPDEPAIELTPAGRSAAERPA